MRRLILFTFIFSSLVAKAQELGNFNQNSICTSNIRVSTTDNIILCDSTYGFKWNFGSWEHQTKKFILYNQKGLMTDYKSTSLNEENDWQNEMELLYIYNDEGLLIEFIDQRRNSNTSELENYTHHYHNYNMNDLLESDSILKWNTQLGIWETKWIEWLSYNNDKNLDTMYSGVWDSEIEKWDTTYRYVYTYYVNGKLKDKLSESWEELNSIWKNDRKFSYTYNEDNQLKTEKWVKWDDENNDWTNLLVFTYDYDDNGYLIQNLRENWDNEINEWFPFYKYIFTNDEDGFIKERLTQYYDLLNVVWKDNINEIFYYSLHETTQISKNEIGDKFFVYPNPATRVLYFSNKNANHNNLRVSIINLLGEKVKEVVVKSGISKIPVDDLEPGLYVFQLKNKSEVLKIEKVIIR